MAFEGLLAVLAESASGAVGNNLVVEALVAQRLAVRMLCDCWHAVHGWICDVLYLYTIPRFFLPSASTSIETRNKHWCSGFEMAVIHQHSHQLWKNRTQSMLRQICTMNLTRGPSSKIGNWLLRSMKEL